MAEPVLLYPFRNRIKRKGLDPEEMMQWLEFCSNDIMKWQEDFLIGEPDGACTDLLGETVDGGSITGTVIDTANGICRLATSAAANKYIGVYPNGGEANMGACFLGNNSAVTWARIKVDGATSCKIEIGFTDDDDDAGAVGTLATPTTNANDCAVWCYDTNDTGGVYWQGVCSQDSTTPTKVEPAKFLPVNDTYEWLGVALLGSAVKFMHCDQYGNPNYESAWQSSGITATDTLTPWIFVQTRNNTEKLLDIDYWMAYQRRTSAND